MGQFLATLVIAFNFYIGHPPTKAPVVNQPQPELTQPAK
jgi:hypothetical protein